MITALYAGLLGLISIWLSFGVGSLRGKSGIPIGDGGNQELLLAMRKHGNFVEYAPIFLILLALLEVNDVSSTAIHVMGGAFVISRICHGLGLKADTMAGLGRLIGAGVTALLILVASIWSIVTVLPLGGG